MNTLTSNLCKEGKRIIDNACTIVAMRELLDDPDWCPAELANHIVEHDGLLSEHFKVLESFAPVKVWQAFYGSGNEQGFNISDGSESAFVPNDQKIIICYTTSGKRGHARCIFVKELERYSYEQTIHTFVTKREEKA